MILYLAATAPGSEQKQKHGMFILPNRLLSYFLIKEKKLECDVNFQNIKKYKDRKK
jgi:hypothetical protein